MAVDPAIIALLGTITGGVGLKVVEHWLGRNKVKLDDATQIRNELREDREGLRKQIALYKDEVKGLTGEVAKWRDEYYDLREEHIRVQTELLMALEKIKQEAAQTIDNEVVKGIIDSSEE